MTELDPDIHQPIRLRILLLLSGLRTADFSFLVATLAVTKGNLSAHMARLEAVGYVRVTKQFVGKVPNTSYGLTPRGRDRLRAYWQAMDALRASRGRG